MTLGSLPLRLRGRAAALRLAVGVVCLTTALVPAVATTATAAEEPGAQLQSFSLSADAPSLRVRQGTEQTEAVVPQTLAQLRNGPVGFGQSATMWPGTIAGNIGSLLVLAADAPKEATILDSPVRAEARTGTGPSEVTNESFPGTVMRASATAEQVTADTTMAATATLPAGTIGASTSTSRSALTGPRAAVAEASSTVQDISLLGGQITVGSVTSTARATTNGATTTVDGRTVVTDVRVAGQRVGVGSDGITVLGQTGPDAGTAVDAVNDVVKAARLVITVSEPIGMQEGGSASFTSGSLLIAFTQSSGAVLSVLLGGANVAVAAVPGEPALPLLDLLPPPPPDTGAPAPADPGFVDIGSGEQVAAAAPLPDAPVAADPLPPTTELPLAERVAFALPGALSPGWLVLALLGSLLVGSALRKVPDAVVAAGATSCPLEERP